MSAGLEAYRRRSAELRGQLARVNAELSVVALTGSDTALSRQLAETFASMVARVCELEAIAEVLAGDEQ